ncbi:type II toxin-antitoxin system RelE/ParE family toxin [Pseudoduganella sp. GCM10020061]|uniref:type II toxin-antitoxin system RelE/ParE family toxin n=1 Tax=Pseudoduganella sp. GCM10020061 TaxID=3317345 RepID=UPI00363F3030
MKGISRQKKRSEPFSRAMVPDTLVVRWTRRAICDLENIAEFISATNPDAAQGLLELVRKKVELLGSFPYLGREFSPGLRELVGTPQLPTDLSDSASFDRNPSGLACRAPTLKHPSIPPLPGDLSGTTCAERRWLAGGPACP